MPCERSPTSSPRSLASINGDDKCPMFESKSFERGYVMGVQEGWSPRSVVKQFGNMDVNGYQLSPKTAAKPPKVVKFIDPEAKCAKRSASTEQPADIGNMAPRKKLERLGRFRRRGIEVKSDPSGDGEDVD